MLLAKTALGNFLNERVQRLDIVELLQRRAIWGKDFNQLVNMRLNEEINSDSYAAKSTALQYREASFKLQLDARDLGRHETAEIVVKAFELSQNLRSQWLTAD